MSARTLTDLVVTEVSGIFLIKTLSGSWYQLICESNSDGDVLLSGAPKLSTEQVRSYKSTIRIGSTMFFWRQGGDNFIRSTDVAGIFDITSVDKAGILKLMTP